MLNRTSDETNLKDKQNEVKPPGSEPLDQSADVQVGLKIRELRNFRHLSLRKLAEISGLNINTLSLIENAKSSPSFSTLQQLARSLDVPMTTFFESEPIAKRVVFTSHKKRPEATFGNAHMENLGKDLAGNEVQPFVVTLVIGAGSGDQMIVHAGHEFVYCLSGRVLYMIEDNAYLLEPGDSLVFESHLPHRWQNICECESQIILVIFSDDQREVPGGHHFPIES